MKSRAFRVGIACYQLRTPLLVTFYPRIDGESGRLTVTPSSLLIVGSGTNLDEAWQDWTAQFHVRFQTLLAKRPWEMDSDEKDEWGRIEQMVDVPTMPLKVPPILHKPCP